MGHRKSGKGWSWDIETGKGVGTKDRDSGSIGGERNRESGNGVVAIKLKRAMIKGVYLKW